MRRYRCYILFVFLLCSISAATAAQTNTHFTGNVVSDASVKVMNTGNNSVDMEFSLEKIEIKETWINGERFDLLSIIGEPESGREGYPALPTVVRMVLVPPRSGVSVIVNDIDVEILTEIHPIPRQRLNQEDFLESVATFDANQQLSDLSFNPDFEKSEGFFPDEIVRIGRPAILRGYRLVPVVINPVRWNPSTSELEVIKSIDFVLDFNSDENRVNLVENPERPRPSRYAHKLVSQLVINPPSPPRDMEQQSGSLIYITGEWDDVVEELEPLVEWRRRMGWKVEVIQTNQNNNRDAVRNLLIEAYEEWDTPPEYITIVGDPDPQYPFTVACHVHANVGNPYETDHPYACLEGDDILPDVAVGRFVFNSTHMLRGIVNKTISYEMEPYVGEGDHLGWQTRAAVASTDWDNGLSANNLCHWCARMFLTHGFTEVGELYCSVQNQEVNPRQLILENFEDSGISFFVYRGWEGLNGFDQPEVDQLDNPHRLPFVILATCNTGDFLEHAYDEWAYTERFLYTPRGGAIGAIGTGGATHTYYNNCLVGGALLGHFIEDIKTQGWTLMRGKVALYHTYYERGDIDHDRTHEENWLTHTYIYNLMGDPAIELADELLTELTVEHSETFRVGETFTGVDVAYHIDDEDVPAAGLLVCLYKPEEFQLTGWTDNEGHVDFHMDPEWTQEGSIQLTVSGHNLIPYMADLEIEEVENFIGSGAVEIDDDDEGESQGDDDGIANPTERLEISVDITNYGSETPEGEVAIVVTPALPYLEVIEGEAALDEAPEPGEPVQTAFVVDIGGAFQHGSMAAFNMDVTVGESTWVSSLSFPVEGADPEFETFEWEGDPLAPAEMADMWITLYNDGTKPTEAMDATLLSLTETIEMPVSEGAFEPIAPGETGVSEETFRLSAHPLHFGGRQADLALALISESGFLDTVYFSFDVGQALDGMPFGPDKYGYVCFDDTDTSWFAAPVFEWIEIDPNHEGPGTDTELRDSGEDQDASMCMDLPFTFSYYGQEFDEITICTNGWIAMGDYDDIVSACNRRIPGGLVTPGMICPFWDDLRTNNNAGIYTWYDEENHLFVVEWSRVRRLEPGQGTEETFEVILLDPEFHPSFTGDSDIIFQYLEVEDGRGAANVHGETPFASVGIASPDLSDGLEYSYWNELHPGAAPLENERVIRFTTMTDFSTAFVHGYTTDAASGDSLEGVLILTDYGFWAESDSTGYFAIEDILVDTALAYTFSASKLFYNDSTIGGIEINPDDTIEVNFALLHPEFGLEFEEVDVSIEQENTNDFYSPLVNTGNGILTFTSWLDFRPPEDDPDDLWDPFMDFDVTNSVVGIDGEDTLTIGNTYVNGVVFVDSVFWVSAGGSDRDELQAKWYRFNRNGDFVDSLSQPWIHNRGIRGLTYDGENIWGGYDHQLYCFDPEDASVVDSFEVPPSIPYGVAYDRSNDIIYTSGITNSIVALDTDGNVINEWDPFWEENRLRKYGLAWYPDQPDSLKLFIFTHTDGAELLFGFNPSNEELRLLADLSFIPNDSPLGIDVSDRWNSSVWTLLTTVSNSDGDRVTVFELEPNTTWLTYSPVEGYLQAREETTLHITVEAGLRPLDRYWVILHYEHDANPGIYEIPISMEVVEFSGFRDEQNLPATFELNQNWPNPFNSSTTIKYSLHESSNVKLKIFDTAGRLVENVYEGRQSAGSHEVVVDASDFPTGVFIYHLEAGSKTTSRKMLLLK